MKASNNQLETQLQTQQAGHIYYEEIRRVLKQFCPESSQKDIEIFARNLLHNILPPQIRIAQFEEDFKPVKSMLSIFDDIILKNRAQHPNLGSIIEDLLRLGYDFFEKLESSKYILDHIKNDPVDYNNILGLQNISSVLYIKTCYESIRNMFKHPFLCLVHVSKTNDTLLSMFATQLKQTQPTLDMLFTQIQNISDKNFKLPDQLLDIVKLSILLHEIFKHSMEKILSPTFIMTGLGGETIAAQPKLPETSVFDYIKRGIFKVTPEGLIVKSGALLFNQELSNVIIEERSKVDPAANNSYAVSFITALNKVRPWDRLIKVALNVVFDPVYFQCSESFDRCINRMKYGNVFTICRSGLLIGKIMVCTTNGLQNLTIGSTYSVDHIVTLIGDNDAKIDTLCTGLTTNLPLTNYTGLSIRQTLLKAIQDVTDHPDNN